jgi:HAD superfamily hydrolase (TIGR01549 family)
VYDHGGNDLVDARRTIVGAAFAERAIDLPSLGSEIADAFTAKSKQSNERYPDTIPVLSKLKSSGFALGLLTNGGLDSQRAKLERFALSDYFQFIGISEEIGFAKADPAIFEQALTALDATAPYAWMVGDHLEWDIVGAQAAGMAAVWFNPNDAASPSSPKPGHVIITLG